MTTKSQRFGKGFEYESRDILREATGLNFERTPESGAWVGGANAAKAEYTRGDAVEIMAGDLICPEGYRWCIECKNHVDVPIHQLFLGERCQLIDEFLEQTYSAANLVSKEPLLFMKYRRSGYKPPKRIKDTLTKAKIPLPKSNTITVGVMVAELYESCNEIGHLNHIAYTSIFSDEELKTRWRFFDLENWIEYIQDRQFLQ